MVTSQLSTAGVGSTFPAPSIARTAKECVPVATGLYDLIGEHGAYPDPSLEHSNASDVAGVVLSAPAKLKLADVEVVGEAGADVMLVSGAAVSAGGGSPGIGIAGLVWTTRRGLLVEA